MKVFFAALAALGSCCLGFSMAQGLKRREAALGAWIRVMDALLASLSYLDDVLFELLIRVVNQDSPADRQLYSAFGEAARRMRETRSLSFFEAFPAARALEGLGAQDTAILLPLLRELGACAREQQLRILTATREALLVQARQAGEQTAKQRRLYLSLGSIGGLALFLCLL